MIRMVRERRKLDLVVSYIIIENRRKREMSFFFKTFPNDSREREKKKSRTFNERSYASRVKEIETILK